MKERIATLIAGILLLTSCAKKEPIEITNEHFHASVDLVTDVMIHDIFSPPVASRVYAYPNIAAYEIMAQANPNYQSLKGKLTNLEAIPQPKAESPVNYKVAALVAHMDLSRQLIFSEDRIIAFRDSLYREWDNTNADEFEASKAYGLEVAGFISQWMDKDNYKQTRTMSKFTVDTDDMGRWQPTPPAYMEGIERIGIKFARLYWIRQPNLNLPPLQLFLWILNLLSGKRYARFTTLVWILPHAEIQPKKWR